MRMVRSFINTLLRNNFAVASILFISLSGLFVVLAYRDHQNNSKFLETHYLENQHKILADKVQWFQEYVERQKEQEKKRLENKLRSTVEEMAQIASWTHKNVCPDSHRECTVKIATKILRPTPLLHGQGHVFAVDIRKKQFLLPDRPAATDAPFPTGKDVIRTISRLAASKGEGFYQYRGTKPEESKRGHSQLLFVKLIPGLDIVMGASEDLEDVTTKLQKDILTSLENIGGQDDQYYFVGTFEGESLLGPGKGRNMLHARDINGVEVVREFIRTAQNGGGFVTYTLPTKNEDYPTYRKLSYVGALPEWEWYIGSGTSLGIIDRELSLHKKQLKWHFLEDITIALLTIFLITASSYLLTRRVVIKVKDNVDNLSKSFEKATRIGAPITSTDTSYSEFQRVKDSANRMIVFLQKAKHLETVLLEINQHSQTSNTLGELLESIHQIMLRELDAKNFFVALIDEQDDTLEYQYCVDATLSSCPTTESISDPGQIKLSLHPIKQNAQVLLSKADIQRLQNEGTLNMQGAIPETWLGVPLRVVGEIKGVMVIQDYDKPNSYSRINQQLIAACSDQIALGIERKRAEEALAQAKNEFESIFNNSQVGIMLLRGGRIFYRGNQRLADILGYDSPNDMKGISMRELHLDEQRFTNFGNTYYDKLNQEEQIQVEYQLRRKDGAAVWCSISGKALNPTDLDEGVVWVIDDLEPRKTMEKQLKEVAEAANTANRAKSEFLANMSHEIRTPMNGVLGMLQLMQTTDLNDEQREYTETAIQSSKRLTQLLTDILDLSRVEAGKLRIAMEPFNLKKTLRQSIELFAPTAKQAGLALKLDMGQDLPEYVIGDPNRLQQILANLIGNALKFTSEGTVTINASREENGRPDCHTILFSISDTGIGIAKDQIGALFSPFSQLDDGFNRPLQGAGLGLSICKRLVALMGGEIGIRSTPGEGTTVFFSLDLKPTKAPPKRLKVTTTLPDAPLKILLAEDDRVSAISAQRFLEKLGCEVMVVEDGLQALGALKKHQFDVVFMDVQMPKMDGAMATKAIRSGEAGPENKAIPIVALTAYAMAGDKDKFLEAGMDHYLSKPLDIAKLKEMVGKLFA